MEITVANGEAYSALSRPAMNQIPTFRAEGFINFRDGQYLQNYSVEMLYELMNKERVNVFEEHFCLDSHYSNITEPWQLIYGTREERALIIDRFFELASMVQMQMHDKSIVFQAVSMIDRFYYKHAKLLINFKETGVLNF